MIGGEAGNGTYVSFALAVNGILITARSARMNRAQTAATAFPFPLQTLIISNCLVNDEFSAEMLARSIPTDGRTDGDPRGAH